MVHSKHSENHGAQTESHKIAIKHYIAYLYMGKKYGFGEGMSRAEGLRWAVRPPLLMPLLMPAKEAVLRPGEAAAAISDSVGVKGL